MLKGRTVLITGATSGIGLATAEACAQEGARVVSSGRNTDAGEKLLSRLPGIGHKFVTADFRKVEQADEFINNVVHLVGQIDGLVNSAGVIHHATVVETSNDHWDETIAVNLSAVFRLCRAAIPVMINQGGGAIVNVASTWGLVGAERSAAYCASKGGLIQLTRSMAIDHAANGVRINAVAPGAVDTPMLEAEAEALGITANEARQQWSTDVPNRRLAAAEDVADAIVFLLSDKSRHIHGATLPVDGGSLAG